MSEDILTKAVLLNTSCEFTMFPDGTYFVENFPIFVVWNPDKNTVTQFDGSYSDYCDSLGVPCGQFAGIHYVENKIGNDFTLILK